MIKKRTVYIIGKCLKKKVMFLRRNRSKSIFWLLRLNNNVANSFVDSICRHEWEKELNYRKRYEKLQKKYKRIIFGQYYMRHIGEMCLTYYLWNIENKDQENVLYVMMPVLFNNKIPNYYFFEKIQEKIELITSENYEFWSWIIWHYIDKIEFSDRYDWAKMREREMNYGRGDSYCFQVMLDDETKRKLNNMGLKKQFVCIYSRDNEYYKAMGIGGDRNNTNNARNSPITDYRLLGEKYHGMGIPLVRMGYHVEKTFELKGIIDYADKYRTEILDFYLLSKCKFFMVSGSGISLIAKLFNTPLVCVNSSVISFGGDMVTPMSPDRDLIIMKKLWYSSENRYLSLDEILYMEGRFKSYKLFDVYHDMGVTFQNNSQKELLDAAEEMRHRINGDDIYTDEDEMLQKQYRNILEKNICISGNHFYNGRFGKEFLKENEWFLEERPIELSIKSVDYQGH